MPTEPLLPQRAWRPPWTHRGGRIRRQSRSTARVGPLQASTSLRLPHASRSYLPWIRLSALALGLAGPLAYFGAPNPPPAPPGQRGEPHVPTKSPPAASSSRAAEATRPQLSGSEPSIEAAGPLPSIVVTVPDVPDPSVAALKTSKDGEASPSVRPPVTEVDSLIVVVPNVPLPEIPAAPTGSSNPEPRIQKMEVALPPAVVDAPPAEPLPAPASPTPSVRTTDSPQGAARPARRLRPSSPRVTAGSPPAPAGAQASPQEQFARQPSDREVTGATHPGRGTPRAPQSQPAAPPSPSRPFVLPDVLRPGG
jgi:hypothetical protein